MRGCWAATLFWTLSAVLCAPHASLQSGSQLELGVPDLPYGGIVFYDTTGFASGGGLAAADAQCQKLGDSTMGPGTEWAALLADEGGCAGQPCRRATGLPLMGDAQIDWPLLPDRVYYFSDNKTLAAVTDGSALFTFPLNSTLTSDCTNQWTGMGSGWQTLLTCDSWRDNASTSFATVGWSCTNSSGFLDGGHEPCSGNRTLFCVGPAARRSTKAICGDHGECTPELCALPFTSPNQCACRCNCKYTPASGLTTAGHASLTPHPLSPTPALPYSAGATILEGQRLEDLLTPEEIALVLARTSSDNGRHTYTHGASCDCQGRGDGTPACNDLYPAVSNASLVSFTTGSALADGDVISMFGDSITWLGGYVALMQQAAHQAGKKNVKFVNRGINGGKIQDIRDGMGGQPSFSDVLATDKPTAINIMIGINDVWFHGVGRSSNVTVFTEILKSLIFEAQGKGIKVSLSTVSVIGEQIDGNNGFDQLLNQFAATVRVVQTEMGGVGLGDVHHAYLAYETAHNTLPAGVGLHAGVLSYDGVHPAPAGVLNSHSVVLLADTISSGLQMAMQAQ